jgi:hypothetical protein
LQQPSSLFFFTVFSFFSAVFFSSFLAAAAPISSFVSASFDAGQQGIDDWAICID